MEKDLMYSTVVNQKLAFARAELGAAAAAAQDGDTINAKLTRHAHLDSAMAQLCSALTYFVAEVAQQYNLELDPAWQNPPGILDAFSASGKQSSEIAELLALRKKPGSWLQELLNATANPLLLAQRFKTNTEETAIGEGMIPLMDVTLSPGDQPSGTVADQGGAKSPLDLVMGWARSAQGLVDRQRSAMVEE